MRFYLWGWRTHFSIARRIVPLEEPAAASANSLLIRRRQAGL